MNLLKQSTAVTLMLGPFADAADGFTAETGLTISQADVRLSKNGAAFAQKGDATAATHGENGYYSTPLSTTDTGTLGTLCVAVSESGARPVRHDFMVVTANTYDSLVSGTDAINADVAGYKKVTFIQTTDTAKTVIEAAAAGTLCLLAPGLHALGAVTITIPDDVSVMGAGIGATVADFTGDATWSFFPGSRSVIGNFTLTNSTGNAYGIGLTGASAKTNWVVRDMRINTGLECVHVGSTAVCSFGLLNVVLETPFEWGINVEGAAHSVYISDVLVATNDPNPTDARGLRVQTGATVYGERFNVCPTADETGLAIEVQGASKVVLADSSLGRGAVHIGSASAYVHLTNCQFDRSNVTGNPSRLYSHDPAVTRTGRVRAIGNPL